MHDTIHGEIQHISCDEIEKYLKLPEENLSSDDLVFIEAFDDRVNNCDVCSERLRVYTLLSLLADEESDVASAEFSLKELFEKIRGNMESLGRNIIDLAPPVIIPEPDFAGARGVKSVKQRNDNDLTESIIASKVEEFFEFELKNESSVRIDLPQEIANDHNYELYLWNVAQGEKPIDGCPMPVERGRKGEPGVATEPLKAGKYWGAVAKVN